MACCRYSGPHRHFEQWVRETVITVPCRPSDGSVCGKHPRSILVNDVIRAFADGRVSFSVL